MFRNDVKWNYICKFSQKNSVKQKLTHLRPSHRYICVNKLTIIGLDNGLSPGRCQDIFWTNDGILLFGPLRINFNEILIEIYIFIQENAFENVICKMAAIWSRPQYAKVIDLCDQGGINGYCLHWVMMWWQVMHSCLPANDILSSVHRAMGWIIQGPSRLPCQHWVCAVYRWLCARLQ